MTNPLATSNTKLAAAVAQATNVRFAVSDILTTLGDAGTALAAIDIPDPFALVDKTGAVDVTDAIQKALDAGLPIPAGRYLVDPVKGLTSSRDVLMDPEAVLVAKPNSAIRYCVLHVTGDDLSVSLGQVLGDRLKHGYVAGSTSEWCYGVQLTGNRIKLNGLNVSQCPGDGLGVSGKDIEIRNIASTQNRRQGMSVFNAPGLKVYDSEFSLTGALGTDPAAPNGPCAGVDIEPDAAANVDVTFERCRFIGNRTAGVLAWLRKEVGGALNITLTDCDLIGNANGANTKALAGAVTMAVNRSRFTKNTAAAVRAEGGSTVTVGTSLVADANTIIGMAQRTATTGTGVVTRYDLQKVGVPAGVIVAGVNNYA